MDDAERDVLEGKVRSMERQLAQAKRREIDIEKESQDALAEAEEFRNAALLREQHLAQELAQTQLDKQALSQDLAAVQASATNLQSSSGAHTQALQQKQAEVQSVRETNRLLDGKIQQLQSQLQEVSASNKQARESVMELTKERGDLDMKQMHTENELRQSQHAKQSLELEKDLLQKDVTLLQSQLDDKSESLRQSWNDANAKVHDLEQQLHGTSSQNQALTASNKQLQQQMQSLSEQLEAAQQSCQDAETQLRNQTAAFEEESASMHTLATRHKEERASLEKDIQTRDALRLELTAKAEAFKAEQQQVTAELRQRLATAEQACHDRDQTIARFKEAMGQENGEAAFLSAMQSPQVAVRSSGQGPLSPVQAYSKYVSVMQERDRLKKELEKWEQFERQVAPEAQKAQDAMKTNAKLDAANARLSGQLEFFKEKAKRCENHALKWRDQLDDEKTAHSVTRKVLREAQHQVSLLVNENRQLSGVREQAVMPAWTTDAMDADLVEFKSIQDLVSKNEALRRQLHEVQLHTEQQLRRKDASAQAEEERRMQSYQKEMQIAQQRNAEAMAQVQHMMQQRDAAQQAAKAAAERQSAIAGSSQDGPQHQQQQQSQVKELEKELARLKQDGKAYREDLVQQLEAAKQAASQARHDAAQARSQATHEANQGQQLQGDKARLVEDVNVWRKQAQENQALISGLNRRLEQLSNDASKARDTASRHGQKAATLEGQLELLRNENQRLSHDCTEHASARWRLTAERDTQQRLSAQQHEQDARERERLHGQLSELQREFAESQAKLAEERSMHQHSSASVQTVQDAADARMTRAEEAKGELQEALSHAERQVAVSEARVTSLQSTLEKSEERAASLDLQLKAKSSSASGAGEAQDGDGDRQAELTRTIAALRKDVADAQKQAAQEAGHVAQYRSLAEGAEENTRIVQEQLDTLKAESARADGQLQEAKAKLAAAEKDLNASRQSAYEDAQAANKEKQEMHNAITNLQAESVIAKRHSAADGERQQKIVADLDLRTQELRQAQSSYNKAVLDHAETVKKLSQQEALVTELQQHQEAHEASGRAAHKAKADAELVWQQERSNLETAAQTAQRRLQDLERVNAELQVHLDSQARAAAGQAPEKDGQLAGLVQYLQKRLRTLEGENTSLEQVVSRLKIDVKVASTRATQADQARLETAEKLRNSLRTQEEHNHQMQQIQELNLLRESNVTLRSMTDRHRKEAEAYSRQVTEVQAQLEPLKRRNNELQAHVDTHQEELKIHEDAMRHAQRRISDLLHKADAVDKAEYERVTTALKAAEEKLSSLRDDVTRLQPLADQLEPLQARISILEAEVQSKAATIEKQRQNVSNAQRILRDLNTSKLKIDDFVSQTKQKLARLDELNKAHPDLQQAFAALEATKAQQTKELAVAQKQIKQLGQEAVASGATTSNLQKQQQADLARAQSEEQGLHLQITALKLEMKQKDGQLAEVRKAKQQLEQQVAATKAQADKAEADLKDRTAQLSEAQTSLASQQAANQPTDDAAQAPMPAPQAGAGADVIASQERHAQLLTERESALQQVQSALQAQEQQLANNQQQLEQQQQQGAAAYSQENAQMAAQVEQLRKQQQESAQAAQQLQAELAQLQAQLTGKHDAATKLEADLADVRKMLNARAQTANSCLCKASAKEEVNKVLTERSQLMAKQLTEAGLPVPPEGNLDDLYQSTYQKCMDKKKPAAAKGSKQSTQAGSPTGVLPAKPSKTKTDGKAVAASGTATESTADAEMLAVRNRALASAKRQGPAEGGAGDSPAPVGNQAAGVTPMLRFTTPVTQQGGKRTRDVSPGAPISSEAQTAAGAPPAKRVRASTPVADPIPAAAQNQQQAMPADASQLPADQTAQAEVQDTAPTTSAALPSMTEPADQAGLASAATGQEHVAKVAVTQQDPERVQVKIEMPSSVISMDEIPQQPEATQQAAAQAGETQQGAGATDDVEMTEDPTEAARSEAEGDDAEDGELPEVDDAAAGEGEGRGSQPQTTAATASQGDGSDADGAGDGAAGGTGRKPIVFNLAAAASTPAAAPSEPTAPASGGQQRTNRTPASGARGRGVAGRSVRNASRGRGRNPRGRQ